MKTDVWAATRPAEVDDAEGSLSRVSLTDSKVMMVDDEPLMTDLIHSYLEDAGYTRFVISNDPREALALLKREEPGVLLLDLMMPEVSGFDLLAAIRADRALRYTPVIVLTASSGADAKLRALQLGATDFLAKPVDESELVLRVRNTLAFRRYHHQLINFDAVTGLPNQRPFDRGLEAMLARRDLVGGKMALFSVHVPECRHLRETINQAAADGLAKAVAQRLSRFASALEADPMLATSTELAPRTARLAADQFAVLVEGLSDAEEVAKAAQRLQAVLLEPVQLTPHDVVLTPWIGVAMSPGDGDTVEALRQGADLASTHARTKNGGAFAFASAEQNARSYERFRLGSQLHGAAQRGELCLHYQPKLDLASNRIVGAEALVRWQHPEHGLLPPARFIPLAEELGLIGLIGDWVIEQALRDLSAWARAGYRLQVAVNVAKAQFESGDLCGTLRRAMFDRGVPASQLVIEITESMLMENVRGALAQMQELKALGVTLSIDDFGTGYSSLSYLKQFPLDELKVDRSFIADLPGSHADLAIVRAVVELGHSLQMSVTAEGVETEGQRRCLGLLGCDTYQGFLFSRAVPAKDLLDALTASVPSRATPGRSG
jgi:predicted signal transduction protein with EAL and GGDEF domain